MMLNVGEVVWGTSSLWDTGYQGSGSTGFIVGSWMGLHTERKPEGHLFVPLQCV